MSVRKLLGSKGNFVPIIRPDSTIADVIEILEVDDAGALVVTRDEKAIDGIITEKDVVRALRSDGPDVLKKSVADHMTRDVVTCEHGQPITSILQIMDEHQVHHVPITENGELCGIINMLDLVKYRLSQIELEATSLKEYVAGRA